MSNSCTQKVTHQQRGGRCRSVRQWTALRHTGRTFKLLHPSSLRKVLFRNANDAWLFCPAPFFVFFILSLASLLSLLCLLPKRADWTQELLLCTLSPKESVYKQTNQEKKKKILSKNLRMSETFNSKWVWLQSTASHWASWHSAAGQRTTCRICPEQRRRRRWRRKTRRRRGNHRGEWSDSALYLCRFSSVSGGGRGRNFKDW